MPDSKVTGCAELLRAGTQALGINLADSDREQVFLLLDLLDRWNRIYNLTGIRDRAEQISRHILDSFSIQPYVYGHRVLDVGTGAGFPGLPLALINRNREFVLLDANAKKIRFVRHAIMTLELANVQAEHDRVEVYTSNALFDTIMTRAVSSLGLVVEHCGHLLAPGGRILAMKSEIGQDEAAGLGDNWRMDLHALSVPGIASPRSVVEIRSASTGSDAG